MQVLYNDSFLTHIDTSAQSTTHTHTHTHCTMKKVFCKRAETCRVGTTRGRRTKVVVGSLCCPRACKSNIFSPIRLHYTPQPVYIIYGITRVDRRQPPYFLQVPFMAMTTPPRTGMHRSSSRYVLLLYVIILQCGTPLLLRCYNYHHRSPLSLLLYTIPFAPVVQKTKQVQQQQQKKKNTSRYEMKKKIRTCTRVRTG